MAEPRDGTAPDRALDRFWDGVARGTPPPARPVLDPADAAAVRRFHAFRDAPPPASSFVARLEEELMRPHAMTATAQPARPGATSGATRHGWALPSAPPARRPRRRRLWRRTLEGLAAAALLLAIAAGLATGWGLLPRRDGRTGRPARPRSGRRRPVLPSFPAPRWSAGTRGGPARWPGRVRRASRSGVGRRRLQLRRTAGSTAHRSWSTGWPT